MFFASHNNGLELVFTITSIIIYIVEMYRIKILDKNTCKIKPMLFFIVLCILILNTIFLLKFYRLIQIFMSLSDFYEFVRKWYFYIRIKMFLEYVTKLVILYYKNQEKFCIF